MKQAAVRLFCGYDPREAIGFHVFLHSVLERASVPVDITPLDARGLPQGSNVFTMSRFLVPYLCGFKGWAIFADACDMLMLADVAELAALVDPSKAVQLVKHTYKTRNPIKYIGTSMQCPNVDYPRKNWASLMLINCEHEAWFSFTPAAIEVKSMPGTLQFRAFEDRHVGTLPDEWNRLVDEGQPADGAKILHWTAGIPAFPHYRKAPGADVWTAQHARMLEIV